MPSPLQLGPAAAGFSRSSDVERSIRVVLADNHPTMRRSLRALLDGDAGVKVIAEASDLPTVLRYVHGHLPQVLVLDLRLQNGSSLETIRHMRANIRGPEIVVVTMEESAAFARQAINAGALGFVLKDRADSDLIDAIRSAARHEEYVSPGVAPDVEVLRETGGGLGEWEHTPAC